MLTVGFLVVAVLILSFGAVSRRIEDTILTPPMVFTAFGLLLCSRVTGWVDIDPESPLIHTLTELTLILVLFTDASRIDLKSLRRDHDIPIRLLGIGMPLTIVFGTLTALALFSGLGFWEALVLAVILAPTDAALGQAVVSSPKVPVRIRQALNVESGLNDGLSLPILLFALSIVGMHDQGQGTSYWFRFIGLQLTLGPLVGIAVGYLGGKLVDRGRDSGWMSESFQSLSAIGLSLMAFAAAELAGGNGFIAAFCAGLTLGNTSRAICGRLFEFAETEGQLLTLLTFMIFGSVMVLPAFDHLSWEAVLYAVLSLTLIRMVPVAISLVGLKLERISVLFLGWFGPRGIASVLLVLVVLEEVSDGRTELIYTVTALTVLLSIYAHGVSAKPAADAYAAHVERHGEERYEAERMPVAEMPVRLPFRGAAD